MKLLFDHNLSPRLVNRLADLFPGAQHVFLLAMGEADDSQIWNYAKQNGYVIVTAFYQTHVNPADGRTDKRRSPLKALQNLAKPAK
jgi:hypothetical protein